MVLVRMVLVNDTSENATSENGTSENGTSENGTSSRKKHNYEPIFLFSCMFSVQYSVFQEIGLMHERYLFGPWCYEDMSLVLPVLNSILSSGC